MRRRTTGVFGGVGRFLRGVAAGVLAVFMAGCATLPRRTAPPDARVHVISLQGVPAGDTVGWMAADLEKNLDGVYRAEGDMSRAELKVWTRADVGPPSIEQALGKRRMHGVFEAGKGSYVPPDGYPVDSDVRVLTISGKDIGALDRHVVPGKVTVFDFYADWCGPCKVLDKKFVTVVHARPDVAIRKLNIVGFSSPLARAWSLHAIPFVVIYGRSGKKTNELTGSDPTQIAIALGRASVTPE